MSSKIVYTSVFLILLLLSLFILANSMTKLLGRDEQMYCTGGVLLAQGKMIYKDFSYPSQLPYHPLLYAALFKLLNTAYYLLVGRIVSSLCDILVMLCIVGIYRHIFGVFKISGILLGLAGAVLYVFNPLVDYANGYAWNHDVVIFCVVLAFWIFISTDFRQKSKYWRIACLGSLLTFASCMRITTALLQLLFFAAILSRPDETIKQKIKIALPFMAATIIFLIWPVWIATQAPRAFFLNLYWIPGLYGKWLHEIGMVYNKIDLIINCITRPGYLVLLIIVVYLYVIFIRKHRTNKKIENRKSKFEIPARGGQLAILLPVVFFIIAIIPPTMWRQYLAMPVPFLVISLAYPLFYLRSSGFGVRGSGSRIPFVLLCVCIVIAVISYPVVLFRTPMLLDVQSWVPIRLHIVSKNIAAETENPKLVLTLAPLFALEGGCNIYNELSAGAIVYRIADRLSPWNRDITHTIGPKELDKLIEKSPPSAVVLGVEEDNYEEAIVELTNRPGREKWKIKNYNLSPPLSTLNATFRQSQQSLSLYH